MRALFWDLPEMGVLLILSAQDIRDRQLDGKLLLWLMLWNAGRAVSAGQGAGGFLSAIFPGLLLSLASRIGREELGSGDACLVLALAPGREAGNMWLLVQTAFLLSAFYAFGRLAAGHFRRDVAREAFPFVPFLTAAAAILTGGTTG